MARLIVFSIQGQHSIKRSCTGGRTTVRSNG
jgi:hypothetical protein